MSARATGALRGARFIPGLVAALALPLAAAAAQGLPDTPSGRLAGRFVALINGASGPGDLEFASGVMSPAFLAAMPADSTAWWFDLIRQQSGGVTVDTAVTMGRTSVLDVTTRRTGRRAQLFFGSAEGDTTRLAFVGVVPQVYQYAGDPPALPGGRVPPDSVMAPVLQLLEWASAHDIFAGTVLIRRGNLIVLDRSFGLRNREARLVNSIPTRYHTGSWGKMMTAVAIGQLVDRGKFRFEDTLMAVLPEYPDPEAARKITIHHLLTHQSGLGGLFDRPGWTVERPFARQADMFPLFAGKPLAFEPGKGVGYSNEAFVVLGAIVEKYSGMSLAEYFERRIWKPAGMKGICDCLSRRDEPLRAVGYASFEDRDPFGIEPFSDNEHFLGKSIANGAGGWYATPRDFTQFMDALMAGKLVKRTTVARLTTPVVSLGGGPEPDYGYGFQLQEFGGKPAIGHGGGGQRVGIGVQSRMFADGSWTVALFGNGDQPPVNRLARQILEYLARQ